MNPRLGFLSRAQQREATNSYMPSIFFLWEAIAVDSCSKPVPTSHCLKVMGEIGRRSYESAQWMAFVRRTLVRWLQRSEERGTCKTRTTKGDAECRSSKTTRKNERTSFADLSLYMSIQSFPKQRSGIPTSSHPQLFAPQWQFSPACAALAAAIAAEAP